MTIRLEILPVKFVLHNKKVEMAMGVGEEEPIKSLDCTVRLSVCSENRKSLGCLERFDYYISTWFAKTQIGPQNNDADWPVLAARHRAPGPLAKRTTPLISYWSNGGG